MATAKEARDWIKSGALKGIGDSLYTPFSGPDGENIDYDAYRQLVRYCVGALKHDMLWLTSGVGEWWTLTLEEKKKLTEIAITEARAINPDIVIQACPAGTGPADVLEQVLFAQEKGADICYIQTPPMEVHAGEGVKRFFQYIADRSDIALGMFNSPSSGYVLTAREMAEIANDIPAVVAVKEGEQDSITATPALHAMCPDLAIWECDLIVYRAGWLQQGIVTGAQLGTVGYLYDTPDNMWYTKYFELIWNGEISEAIRYADESGLDRYMGSVGLWYVQYPGRSDYFTHWGEAFKYGAHVVGLPIGDYMGSRPPQGVLPQEGKDQIRAGITAAGMAGAATKYLS